MAFLRRALASFPLRALLILILLLLPWPRLDRAFSGAMAGLNDAILGDPSSQVLLAFQPPRSGGPARPWEVLAIARERDGQRIVATAIDTRRAGYVQDATFVALTLAMRTRRARKLVMLAIGLLALQVVPLLPALAFFSSPRAGLQVFQVGALGHWLLEIAYRALIAAPGMAYAAAGLLWLLLTRALAPEEL